MSKTTKVVVPKEAGDSIQIFDGGESQTYKVTDGHVTVASEDVDKFLGAVTGSSAEGSKPDAGITGDGK